MKNIVTEAVKTLVGLIYARRSVDDPDVQHDTKEQQVHIGRELARQLTLRTGIPHLIKYELVEDGGASGGNTNRLQYQHMLQLIQTRKVDFICAKEISRLSRSVTDFCDLMKLCRENFVAVYIHGLDFDPNTPMGGMMFNLLAIIAEFERKLGAQRTKDSLRSAMLHNAKINGGPPPLGFDLDPKNPGYWIPNTIELKKVRMLMEIFLDCASPKQVLDESKKLGIKNKKGTNFNYNSLKRILSNEKFIGKMTVIHGQKDELKTVVDLPHGEVVPVDLFNRVQLKLAEMEEQRVNLNRLGTRVYLLTGLLLHSDGSSYRGTCGTSRSGDRVYYYRNDKNKVTLDAKSLELSLILEIKKILSTYQELENCLKEIEVSKMSKLDVIETQITAIKSDLKKIDAEEEPLLTQLSNMAKVSSSSVLTWLEKKTSQLTERRLELENRMEELVRDQNYLNRHTSNISKSRTALTKILSQYDEADPAKQRNLLRHMFEKIEVFANNEIKYTWRVPGVTPEETIHASEIKWRSERDSNPRPSA